jgi:hypothetical protein
VGEGDGIWVVGLPSCPFTPHPAPWSPPAACRVWDIRSKVQVHCLSGHEDTVASILAFPTDPQVGRLSPRGCAKQGQDWASAAVAFTVTCQAPEHSSLANALNAFYGPARLCACLLDLPAQAFSRPMPPSVPLYRSSPAATTRRCGCGTCAWARRSPRSRTTRRWVVRQVM